MPLLLEPIDPHLARIVMIAALSGLVILRVPHWIGNRRVNVARQCLRQLEDLPLTLVKIASILPVIWFFSPIFSIADYPSRLIAVIPGTTLLVIALWLFHRSHADLGTNWSAALELKEDHRLVTDGIYREIRHPMYLALFVFALGQILVLPNHLVAWPFGLAMIVLFVHRVDKEEAMMLEEFGEEYRRYQERSHLLIPRIL